MFSVIIPATRPVSLSKLLQNLLNQLDSCDEMIVALNENDKACEKVCEKWGVSFVKCRKHSPAAARNTAIRRAEGTHILFLDDDVTPCPELLSEYRKKLESAPQAACVAGFIDPPDAGNIIASYFRAQPWTFRQLADGKSLVTCNLCVRNEGLLFDEAFDFSCEDMAFSRNFHGRTTVIAPEARVRHDINTGFMSFCWRFFRYGRGYHLYLRKFPRHRRGRKLALLKVIRSYLGNEKKADAFAFAFLEIVKYASFGLGIVCARLFL